jgi:Xaa-Pro aminopeptidase
VLIDAAGEYHNYGADITRTFPINGRFSEPQRAIYELVLQTQEAIIKSIKPGIAFESLQQKTVALLTEGLVKLKILSGDPAQLIAQKAYLPFYMHNVSHWLGLDTHDAGSYQSNGKSRLLEAGMVLTVEPGLYFRPDPTIDKQWWNIGVRIEDDILVTENGYDILSQDAPKKITDLENLIGEKV